MIKKALGLSVLSVLLLTSIGITLYGFFIPGNIHDLFRIGSFSKTIFIIFISSLIISLVLLDALAQNMKYSKKLCSYLFLEDRENGKLTTLFISKTKGLFERKKIFWITIGLTSILCFLFTIANSTITIDDEYVIGNHRVLRQLRWGYDLINSILGITTALSAFSKIIALCELILAVLIWAKIFEKISDKRISEVALSLFSCALLASPFIASLNAWVFCNTNYFLSFAVAGMSSYCFLKIFEGNHKFLYIILFVLIGVIPNDYGYGVIAVGGTSVLLLSIFYNYKKFTLSSYLKQMFALIGLTGSVVVTDRAIGRLLAFIFDVYSVDYQNMYFRWNFSKGVFVGLINGLKSCVNLAYDTIGKIEIGLIVFGIAIFIILSIKRKTIMPLVGFISFATSAFALNIVTANYMILARTRFPEAFLLAALLMIFYEILKDIKFLRFVPLKIPVLLFSISLILTLCRVSNTIHLQHFHVYQFDTSLMKEIYYDVGKIDATREKPVTFLGSIEYSNSRYDDTFAHGATVNSYFMWDRMRRWSSEKYSGRISNFFNYHGYNLNIGCFDDEDNLRREYDTMTAYPQDGSIKDCGEYILIKLGENTNLPQINN